MLLDDFDRFARASRAALRGLESAVQANADQLEMMARRAAEAGQLIVDQAGELEARMAAVFVDVDRAFKRLPEKYGWALRTLAMNGWYLDPRMSFSGPFAAAELIEGGKTDRASQLLCDYFENRLNDIERDLCARFVPRRHLLASAFEAHQRGDYALSVPVFLAQADGICKELVGVQLYGRDRAGVPKLAATLGIVDATSLKASVLAPLVEPTPISASEKERAGRADVLSRHAILHGESLDYDTQRNSCRSVSLLTYVAWVLGGRFGPDRAE